MEKASIKHLDFHLQREKARSKDLEVECKGLHAQIAQLEQDKAGLRREKLVLSEEVKKVSKLEDRIHSLQKDIESRDSIIASERAAAEQARAETDEVRTNANASIAQWVEAESQWTAEQAALNDAAVAFRSKIDELESTLRSLKAEALETVRLLDAERDRAKKLSEVRDALDSEVRNFHTHTEKLQNKICDLEQTIYKLDLAGDKQREAIDLKDTEIRTLETALENERKTVERMEQTVTSLNDRINAVKMVSLGEKSENEKLQCDVSDARKEIARLNLHVESLKRDVNFAAQSQASLQKALDEMKDKCRQQQEDLKEKSVEIRRHELTISQLNVELKKSENQGGEWSFQNSTLEAELSRLKDALKAATMATEELLSEKEELSLKIRQLQSTLDAKEEEMVMLRSQCDEKLEILAHDARSLEKEVAARQRVINDLTEQLNSTSEKNVVYHSKILEESEAIGKVRQELAQVVSCSQSKERDLLFSMCAAEKSDLFATWLSEWNAFSQIPLCEWIFECRQSQSEAAELRQQLESSTQSFDAAQRAISDQKTAVLELEGQIDCLQQQLKDRAAVISALTISAAASENCAAGLKAELAASTQRIESLSDTISALNEQIILKEAEVEEVDALRAKTHSCALADLTAASAMQRRALEMCREEADAVSELWRSRAAIVFDLFSVHCAHADEEKAQLQLSKEMAEAACRELTAFAKEAKVTMNKGDKALSEKLEGLHSRIALLEGQAALSQREKEQTGSQLSALLHRFEEEQKSHGVFRKEAQCALEAERARFAVVERDLSKLRSAVHYEVSRKCEYKVALEGAKRLLSESEEMRAADSARALEAINKANKESNYWVLCFDRLKGMVEQSRKHGRRLPSIDADTIHRLEEAKLSIGPIQSQDVNSPAAASPKLKRLRDESAGPRQ